MFIFKNYMIEQDGQYNISLYKMVDKEIREGSDFGAGYKGKGKPTGEFKKVKEHQGFYSTFNGAFERMCERVMSDAGATVDTDLNNLKEVLGELKDLVQNVKTMKIDLTPSDVTVDEDSSDE